MRSAGANGMSERELYRVLGVDFDHDLSIANLQTDVRKDAFWSNGEDFLFGLIGMLVLDEAAAQSPRLRSLLASTREDPAFSVNEPDLGKALAYRINTGWRLRGEERQAQRERALRLNTFRGDQGIFDPLGKNLCTAIFGSSVSPNPTGGTVKTWTGTIPRQGGFAYLPRFEDPIHSGAGTIEATLTGPSGASFQFLLISLDRYSVVATASGSGPVKTLRYTATPGRYVWYVQAQTGSGTFLIEARIP
ncbi:MAG: hypothetical protein JNK48_34255 [Bryobacterales bacterium]|nr:hypothetical protein [Bryobacterales bacterium]